MAVTHTYKFNVSMSCSGCSGAIDRVLKKLDGKPVPCPSPAQPARLSPPPPSAASESRARDGQETEKKGPGNIANAYPHPTGVESYEVSLENQTATVVAQEDLPYEKVLQTISKTGKKVNTGEADGVSQSVEVAAAA
jgi:copper chaperone